MVNGKVYLNKSENDQSAHEINCLEIGLNEKREKK